MQHQSKNKFENIFFSFFMSVRIESKGQWGVGWVWDESFIDSDVQLLLHTFSFKKPFYQTDLGADWYASVTETLLDVRKQCTHSSSSAPCHTKYGIQMQHHPLLATQSMASYRLIIIHPLPHKVWHPDSSSSTPCHTKMVHLLIL